MTDRRYWPSRPAFPNELKTLFEQLAVCAVASTFGAIATGCAASRPANGDANSGGAPSEPPGDWHAPNDIVQRCAQAALEEIEHTRITTALARRFGAEPALPSPRELAVRSALAIALENAVEGCVRETFGALIAHCQAAAARDPDVQRSMAVIAGDETRHAELSWMVAHWLEPQLSPAEQQSVAAARLAALHQLATQADVELESAERSAIGWPCREAQAALLARLSEAIA
jgi:hypothetical protein